MAGADPLRALGDAIFLEGYLRQVDIGVFDEERGVPQSIRVSVRAELLPAVLPRPDAIDHVLSYDRLVEAIEAVATGPRLDLVETFAEHVAGHVLRHQSVSRVTIRVEKLDRLGGNGVLGCELVRGRG